MRRRVGRPCKVALGWGCVMYQGPVHGTRKNCNGARESSLEVLHMAFRVISLTNMGITNCRRPQEPPAQPELAQPYLPAPFWSTQAPPVYLPRSMSGITWPRPNFAYLILNVCMCSGTLCRAPDINHLSYRVGFFSSPYFFQGRASPRSKQKQKPDDVTYFWTRDRLESISTKPGNV